MLTEVNFQAMFEAAAGAGRRQRQAPRIITSKRQLRLPARSRA
jgi:hypothetical protein